MVQKISKKKIIILAITALSLSVISGAVLTFILSHDNSTDEKDLNNFIITNGNGAFSNDTDMIEIIDGKIHYRSGGSSTCPPLIEKVSYEKDAKTIVLHKKDYGNKPCTMDYRPVHQIIESDNGVEISQDIKIIVK